MKKFLLGVCALFTIVTLYAQTIPFCQTFNPAPPKTGAGSYTLSQGAKIDAYLNPDNGCVSENGIITPGVGGNNPANILTPVVTSPNAGANVFAGFDIWAYDANLTCASRAAQFLCTTLVDIYVVKSTYTSTDAPPVADILADFQDFPMTNTGPYALVFQLPAGVSQFRILYRFSAQGNCNQPGTKYVLDNFCFSLTTCQDNKSCPPVANNDAFNMPNNSITGTLKGNLYGSNITYTPAATFETRSLQTDGINCSVTDGFDGDVDNHSQAQMTWTLINAGSAATYGTVTVNPNGTFSFVRNGVVAPGQTVVSFTYQLTDPTFKTAQAIVCITIPAGGGLPVKFASFTAQQVNGKVALNWSTASEQNNKHFEVQRKISNGGYQTIATIPSKASYGNSGVVLNYSLDDIENLSGKGQVYYRIRQVDLDGRSGYSEIRSIRNNAKKFNITLYPNPSSDLVRVTIPEGAGLVDVSVSDMSGKEIIRWNATSQKNLQITNLKPGMYTVRVNIRETGDMLVDKLLIQ